MPRPPTYGYLRSGVAEEAKLHILRGELVLYGSIRQQLERRILDSGADLRVLWGNGERLELRA